MTKRRIAATVLTTVLLVGLTTVWGQRAETGPRPLNPRAVSVRLLLGVGDAGGQPWSGSVELDKGQVLGLEGWRFRQGDRITGPDSWEASTRPAGKKGQANKAQAKKTQGKKAAAKQAVEGKALPANLGVAAKAAGAGNAAAAAVAANGVVATLDAPDDATLTVKTNRGSFTVALADLADGAPKTLFNGRAEVQRVPTSAPLVDSPDQDDYPSAAADAQGVVWVAYVVHKPRGPVSVSPLQERPKSFASYVPDGGGDQVRLVRFADGRAGEPIDVTGEGLDVWRPSVAVDGKGAVVVAWSENRDGNFDVHTRRYDPASKSWGEPKRLTTDPGADADVTLAAAPDGAVWAAWQGWRNGRAAVLLAALEGAGSAVEIGPAGANAWSPSLAIDTAGRAHVAYDTYQNGSYDVHVRTRAGDGTLGAAVAVADSPKFEARPSVAVDGRGRTWVAYEERDAEWGKDAENLVEGQGSTLYRGSAVRVRVVDGPRRLDAPDPLAKGAPVLRLYNSFPRLAADRSGRVWLACRHRLQPQNNGAGGVWLELVSALSGREWSAPQPLPRSDGMLDNRPSLVVPAAGPPLIVYAGDGRLQRDGDGVANGLSVAALSAGPAGVGEPALTEAPATGSAPTPTSHPNEPADVARLRAHRIEAGGKTYRLLRGEFHRHTEISGDGGNDGALEDMWRYAIDAGALDWIGNGDHDNGGGKEYTWWITQKTTDLYHSPGKFTPMFTYERSVQYPHGHRNVMWDRRGIRTLPRLQAGEGPSVANGTSLDDTKMLYDYLNELGGICASHTSGTTGMGTDWRDNDDRAEPIVEIFQGHRNSYEHLGGPRVGRTNAEAIAGMQPYGMIWNALGLRYKLGFQASSDHISTHISLAVAVAEDQTRAAILDAFKRRHCYAATDNILLDVRSGDHLMGDEFESAGPVQLRVIAHGTRPIAKVDVIKDFVYVYSTEPNRERVEFTWTDSETRTPPVSWYYVRVIQDDGELAWGSPIWVRRPGRAAQP